MTSQTETPSPSPATPTGASQSGAAFSVRVTVENFRRAETDHYFAKFAREGAFGRLQHARKMTPVEQQPVIRLNRDTLYSVGVFDLEAGPLTVTLPEAGKRYLAAQVVDEDHFAPAVLYAPGRKTLTREEIGTRYIALLIRVFVDPNRAEDLNAAHALQDAIEVKQVATGNFAAPAWDEESLKNVRSALLALAAASGRFDSSKMFGRPDEVDPVMHLLGTATAWGGNPRTTATYIGGAPEVNDGQTPYQLTLREVPVDSFWSVSVYNQDGFFEKNETNTYTVNGVTAEPNPDGSITIHFGGDRQAANYIHIMPGWNYAVRLYRPQPELLDGTWSLPELERAD